MLEAFVSLAYLQLVVFAYAGNRKNKRRE